VSNYETSDASIRSIAKFGVGLLVLMLFAMAVMWLMFRYLAARPEPDTGAPPSPMLAAQEAPPAPRLQVTPRTDLESLRSAEQAVLNSYGWVNREAGVVRIPISRAIELLAQRGLPAQASPTRKQ